VELHGLGKHLGIFATSHLYLLVLMTSWLYRSELQSENQGCHDEVRDDEQRNLPVSSAHITTKSFVVLLHKFDNEIPE
jgi:hypothetical protein